MPSITIRDVPEETRAAFAARARRSGRPLQEYLRSALIALSSKPDPVELAARVSARKAATGTKVSSRQILDHRDRGRR